MAIYIILVVLASVILALLITIKSENFSTKNKIIVGVLFVLLVISVIIYELNSTKDTNNLKEVVNAFNQGKELTCKDYQVNSTRFNYVGGTMVFMGKNNITELKGVTLFAKDCEIK
ncbi:MAG: hypothetical protein ACK5LP_00125 [Campylobacteraceae bacterium]